MPEQSYIERQLSEVKDNAIKIASIKDMIFNFKQKAMQVLNGEGLSLDHIIQIVLQVERIYIKNSGLDVLIDKAWEKLETLEIPLSDLVNKFFKFSWLRPKIWEKLEKNGFPIDETLQIVKKHFNRGDEDIQRYGKLAWEKIKDRMRLGVNRHKIFPLFAYKSAVKESIDNLLESGRLGSLIFLIIHANDPTYSLALEKIRHIHDNSNSSRRLVILHALSRIPDQGLYSQGFLAEKLKEFTVNENTSPAYALRILSIADALGQIDLADSIHQMFASRWNDRQCSKLLHNDRYRENAIAKLKLTKNGHKILYNKLFARLKTRLVSHDDQLCKMLSQALHEINSENFARFYFSERPLQSDFDPMIEKLFSFIPNPTADEALKAAVNTLASLGKILSSDC